MSGKGSAVIAGLHRTSRSLGWRLVFLLTLGLGVLLGTSGWLALQLHERHLVAFLEANVANMGETILSSTHASMLENDQRHLTQIVENMGGREDVLSLRIFDSEGRVRHSSAPEELGQVGDLEAPTCRGCHTGTAPARAPASPREGLHLYSDPQGRGSMGMVVPILNEPACSANGCHVHPAAQKVLGVLDLQVSTASLDAAMHDARQQLLGLILVTALAAPMLMGALSWRMVHQPLRRLLRGIQRLEKGDLGHRIPSEASAEMEEVAQAFNHMSDRLQRADQDLRSWNETLERRVEEKTVELARTRDRIVIAEKMASLGELSAIVAHEINNPLAGVLVYAKLAKRRLPEDGSIGSSEKVQELREMLTTIERETARCSDIARNLLLMSRQGQVNRAPEALAAIADRSLRLVRHQAEVQGVEVEVDHAESLPPVVCNGGEIQQAITVLIMNAIEAMPHGGHLTVRTMPARGVEGVRFEVADTGIGIPEDIRTRVFEPYFTTKEGGHGTGLGLAVLYGIVKRHGGETDFESSRGKGTRFWFELPLAPEEKPAETSPDEASHRRASQEDLR